MKNGRLTERIGGRNQLLLIATAILMTISVSAFKYRSGEINYYNSDATWHTLLTVEAYNETPISEHLFLPIITLGSQDDKYITWGATLPDEKGNYYYTSFSAAGYFLPWLFMRIFKLPVTEQSLYLFNSFLFAVSSGLWTWFIYKLYMKSTEVMTITVIGMFTYIFSPEILHGMGIVYWHQSVMQVTLLLQIIAYYKMRQSDRNVTKSVFYFLALLNPYIEWTGYIVNVGFALADLIFHWKINRKTALIRACIIGIISAMSFGMFALHYILRVDARVFFWTIKSRFLDRSIVDASEMTDVFGGYFKSFLYLWILLGGLIIWSFIKNKKLELRYGMLMFVMTFPVIENIIMKEHAISYSYDRMKGIYILSFLVCEVSFFLLRDGGNKLVTLTGLMAGTTIACGLNLRSYIGNDFYIWETDYRKENQILADYINENYGDSMLATGSNGVRGYINLLFGRGIFENMSAAVIKDIAAVKGKQYAILLEFEDGWDLYNENWNLSRITAAEIYKVKSGERIRVDVQTITNGRFGVVGYQLADLTDANWKKGYSKYDNTLLFYRDDDLLIDLLTNESIKTGDEVYYIENVDFDEGWIRVLVDRKAENCMYPAMLQIE